MRRNSKKVLVTGANGFIGKNLLLHLAERQDVEVVCFTKDSKFSELPEILLGVDFVFHLAGVNRASDYQDFLEGNISLTSMLCAAISKCGRKVPVIYTSSTQATLSNSYGISKKAAEKLLLDFHIANGSPVYIFRLPNVFGKWCRPNYNSVVATFCHNIAHELPILINDPSTSLTLVHIDDVIERFIQLMDGADFLVEMGVFGTVNPQYTITLGELSDQLYAFKDSCCTLLTERVGVGLVRALYSTYVSYLPKSSFAYTIPIYKDARGVFVEMLKTPDCGQFSYFTVYPGATRGGHYHHSKTEKFLVIKGSASFRFRNMSTNEVFDMVVREDPPFIVETIPGWAHDITNIGEGELLVMLWANELFDCNNPDTYACPL
jgi:UDP-2-acetamido-2,6-beta-L-arabino-hexul-4-ose reductase